MGRKVTKTKKKNALLLFLIPVFMILIAGFFSFSVVFDTASALSYGGAVYVGNNSYYTLNSGSISGYNGEYWGAGVFVDAGGTFNMGGGSIYGNYATNFGNNIYNRGTVNLAGGSVYSDSSSGSGNNIYNSSLGTITIYGGTIGNNQATILNDGTLNINGGTIKDKIQTTRVVNTKMSATITGTIQLIDTSAYVAVQDYAGTTPSYTIKPAGVNTKIMTLIGSSTEPDVSKIKIEGYTLTDKLYLKTEQNSSGNWEISLVERVTTVTFSPNGGETSTSSKVVAYDATYGDLPTPTRAGFKFLGWSRNYFDYNNIGYKDSTCTQNGSQFTFKPTSSSQTTYALYVNSYLGSEYVTYLYGVRTTGQFSFKFTKTSSFDSIYIKYNGNVEDSCLKYSLSTLTDGKTYVLSGNVTTMELNNIVVKDIMIEENSENVATTYTNDYVTSTTTNNQLYNHTLFARWQELYCTVYVRNLSGTGTEGTVMGQNYSYSKKYKLGESFTVEYTPSGKYTFAKVVNGTSWDNDTITDLTHTITEADLSKGSLYYTVCYTFTLTLHSYTNGKLDEATGGTVKDISLEEGAATTTSLVPYLGADAKTLITATASTRYFFEGWFDNEACQGVPLTYIYAYDLPFGDDGDVECWARFIRSTSVRPYFTQEWRTWYEDFTGSNNQYLDEIREIQFRTEKSITANNRTSGYTDTFKCKEHSKSFSKTGELSENGMSVYQCGVTYGTKCVIFSDSGTIYADEDMTGCFANLTSLKHLYFENFDTSSTTNMTEMFSGCTRLKRLDLSGFNTRHVTNFARMFYNCNALTSLDISNFEIQPLPTDRTSDMLSFSVTNLKFLYTPKICQAQIQLPAPLYDNIDATLDDLLAQSYNINQGQLSVLPMECRSSRTLVKELPEYVTEITSDDIKNFATYLEITSGSFVDLEFAFEEPESYFTHASIRSGSRFGYMLYAYMKDVKDIHGVTYVKLTIITERYYRLSITETGFFANLSTKLNSSGIKLNTVKFRNIYTDELSSFEGFFKNCVYLQFVSGMQNLHVKVGTLRNPNSMAQMFYGCSSLLKLDMSNMILEGIMNTSEMFYKCSKLVYLDMRNVILGVDNTDDMFYRVKLKYFVTPKYTDTEISLTTDADYVYVDKKGNQYLSLSTEYDGSFVLTYNTPRRNYTDIEKTRSDFKDFANSSNETDSVSKIEKMNVWTGYSAFALICISAIAYPVYEEQRRKIKKKYKN